MVSTTTTNNNDHENNKSLKRSRSSLSSSSSNRFLFCFRPVVMDNGGSVGPERSCSEPLFTYVAKEDVVFHKIPSSVSSSDKGGDRDRDGDVTGKKKGGHRIFSRFCKAVFIETSLAKKIKRRKHGQKLLESNGKLQAQTDKIPNENQIHQEFYEDKSQRITSYASSSLCSSSLTASTSLRSSSISSNLSSLSEGNRFRSKSSEWRQRQDNVQEHGKGCFGSASGFCLLLVSLLVLIFWGKICAIFCTSTWLFLVPRWGKRNYSSENGVPSPEIGSEEHKKKIIMEGLLERNRFRSLQHF